MSHASHRSRSPAGRPAATLSQVPLTVRSVLRRSESLRRLAPIAAFAIAIAPALGYAGDSGSGQSNQQSNQQGSQQSSQQSDPQSSDQSDQQSSQELSRQLTEVTITAAEVHSIDQFTPTGSRLGLSIQELPATLDVISSDEMLGRGFASVEEAADSQPGVVSGGSPGDLEQFSMRGFTGDEITELRNGLYIGPEDMVGRPENTFNVASVEILQGPASVLFGLGAVGGAVNVVDKGPSFGPTSMEALVADGSFGSTELGIGGNTHVGDLAFRLDASRTSTDGYVQNSPAYSNELTGSMTWRINDRLSLQFSMDYMQDRPSGYFGTPLVPISFATDPLKGVLSSATVAIDKPMEFVNYNVANAHIGSTQVWPHIFLSWHPTDNISVENYVYYLRANRDWYDAETYTFDTDEPGYVGIPRIDRDRFFVIHHQNMIGDQGSVTLSDSIFGHANKVVVGYEYSHLEFYRTAGGPPDDNVDPFVPDQGIFNTLYPTPLASSSSESVWNDYSAFFEDVFDITKELRLVTGGHYDQMQLSYLDFGGGGGYNQTYITGSERIGLVYNVNPYLTPYIAYSTANDPPNGEIFESSPEIFPSSHAWQVEGGVKGGSPSGNLDFTAAVYRIQRDNILTQTGLESFTNVGGQASKGGEFSTDFKLTPNWTVSMNGSYTDSKFSSYVDPDTGVDDTGNQPADVPKWTANAWTSYQNVGGVPLELGGGVRYIGKRWGDEANTLLLEDYTLVNLYASYHVTPGILVTARVNNALNKEYAQWADIYYPTQVLLGPPRYFEVSLVMKY